MKNTLAILAIAGLLWIGMGGAVPHVPIPGIVLQEPLIAGDGLHVLILADRLALTRQQMLVVDSSELQGWLIDNKAQWHIWPPSQDTTSEPPEWQAAMKLPHDSLPWLIASEKGKPNFSGPLPETLPATIEVLSKYAK